MNNNPFRNQQQIPNGDAYFNPSANQAPYSQPQYPQQYSQQQQPQQPNYSNSLYQNAPSLQQQQLNSSNSLYQTPSSLQQQQQQPNLNSNLYQTPSSLQQQQQQQQQQYWQNQSANTYQAPPPSQFSPYNGGASLTTTPPVTSSFGLSNNATDGFTSYNQPQNPIAPTPTGYLQQQQSQMPMPYYSQFGNIPLAANNPSNMYIPSNFGMSTTPSYQPKHPPVDASALLKGTQVRRVECPVCQKMLEGDDMAINHHVNEHYN
ncbi:hypothetical protein G6F57_005503 [Rhizopus arrhizus]|uniref:Uncharacterized protein n=1 Tax=Rhizopus oryzae TaxID=64495 RepID=A0A9P6XER5_RHIOR|nr:hypothetical protein G6F23_002063 [Rhizopus arrhizus]KAG1425410.1 hypothetical protein G6F58_001938 [Rhizopus delemar]KAG0764516.1 hypothetical protein G6F24_005158 [Rhizopus arrhizus]KAG0791148.1 hypothetical protein G6F21_005293 [Rhizopus arrhizus]KAG0800355.1 hypothetical protein G6F22_002317 [Rhizopus arrhizus]